VDTAKSMDLRARWEVYCAGSLLWQRFCIF